MFIKNRKHTLWSFWIEQHLSIQYSSHRGVSPSTKIGTRLSRCSDRHMISRLTCIKNKWSEYLTEGDWREMFWGSPVWSSLCHGCVQLDQDRGLFICYGKNLTQTFTNTHTITHNHTHTHTNSHSHSHSLSHTHTHTHSDSMLNWQMLCWQLKIGKALSVRCPCWRMFLCAEKWWSGSWDCYVTVSERLNPQWHIRIRGLCKNWKTWCVAIGFDHGKIQKGR